MPLDAFGPVAVAAAAAAAGRRVVPSIVCGALTPRVDEDGVVSTPELYAVTASLLRKTFVTGDFGVTGLHAVSLPFAGVGTERQMMTCLQSLDRTSSSLLEFEVDYNVDEDAAGEALLARTCDVVRRHRHTLRRLKVPTRQHGRRPAVAGALADALAECTAITSLDVYGMRFPFRSWHQLGSTLHTLKLCDMDDDGTNTTHRLFRLLADHMPALRDLHFDVFADRLDQNGFIEVVSRLRSLTLSNGCPWASVRDPAAWPLTLPNLEELLWWGFDAVNEVAIAVLRRAVSLRAVDVSHASALAAVAAGSLASEDAAALPSSLRMHAPLSKVQRLVLCVGGDDIASFATTLAASPRASAVQLWWRGPAVEQSRLWDLFYAAASAALGEGGAEWRSVRKVCLDLDSSIIAPDPNEAARRVRALFPRARYASWWANGVPDVQLPSL
jgi:hypothetical protein